MSGRAPGRREMVGLRSLAYARVRDSQAMAWLHHGVFLLECNSFGDWGIFVGRLGVGVQYLAESYLGEGGWLGWLGDTGLEGI